LVSVSIETRFGVELARANAIEGLRYHAISDDYRKPTKDLSPGTSFAYLKRNGGIFGEPFGWRCPCLKFSTFVPW